jgi:diacylglycerol kinase (ATP)
LRRLLLAYNPVSGHARFKRRLDYIIRAFQKRDCLLLPYRTTKDNHEFPEVVEAAQADGVIAAGGDGTVHQIVNLLKEFQIDLPLGIIGSGTSNDFASYLKIDRDYSSYFDKIAEGRTRKIDLGLAGNEYFINVASAGMMTSIAHEVPSKLKNSLGKFAYYSRVISRIPKIRTLHFDIVADEKKYSLDAFLFIIVNSATVGGFHNIIPVAEIDDGKLDFLAITKANLPQLVTASRDLIEGRSVLGNSAVHHLQALHFEVSCTTNLESDLDGEAGPELPLCVDTVPMALEIFA